ncbi:MAG: HAMP domain-containing sensor histidine kinase [Photobacterium frigidiphilum]|uniref:sensor histidine kinase n=1 Tax=Photobacterium frigidiphilum TaxID=264736 RepID=UPI00300395AF
MQELFVFSLYMLYGLIFIAIGFTIFFRDLRFSHLSIASALPTLAIFGFIHGLHEWSELYLHVYQEELMMHQTVKILKVVKLWTSFIALGYFALQMLAMTKWRFRSQLFLITQVVTALFFVGVVYRYFSQDLYIFVRETTFQIRWLFGSGAGMLAGAALMNYSKKLKQEERKAAGAVGYLGISIIVYGLFAGLFYIEHIIVGPMIRTLLALVMLIYLRKTLELFDAERQQQIERSLHQVLHNDKLRDIGELASGIAHEIKTPLSSALMRCDLLEKQIARSEYDRDNAQRQLEHIRKGLLKAAYISQEILQFSHKRIPVKQRLSVAECIQDSLELMVHRLNDFQVKQDIAPDLFFYADKEQLEEVVINIVNNAIDASIDKRVIFIHAEQRGLRIKLSITDFGTGIDESIKDKVLLPFFTTKDKSTGTGLGLTLCQKMLEQNQGKLSFFNTKNGLCVEIELPMES